MGFKFPRAIPAEQVPQFNAVIRPLLKFSELAAPEAFKWLGWATAVAAVQFASSQIDAWILRVLPWALFFLLVVRIQWAIRGLAKEEEEGRPVPIKWSRWQILAALASWFLAYQIAFAIPAELVRANRIQIHAATEPAELLQKSQPPRSITGDAASPRAAPVVTH